jgi:hypothetical protein
VAILELKRGIGRAVQQEVRLSPRLSPGGCGRAL